MKRLSFLISFVIMLGSSGFAQSKRIIDDIYVSPNDAAMVQEVQKAKKSVQQKSSYRNGAKEIVFIDQNGNRTNAVTDTVYVIDNQLKDSVENDDSEGGYLNGFNGSASDLEYAERIRRFHNPRYTISIADPNYNDIYFLDNNDWNVYIDNWYAYVTPTWTNPYWWNYQYSPFSYNSWYWRGGMYSSFGWGGGYGGFYDPWYSSYYPWYSGYGYGWGGSYGYGSYYGWGYPYYGGCYGGGYPYYGGYYDGGYYNNPNNNTREYGHVGRFESTEPSGRSTNTRQSSVFGLSRTGTNGNSYTTVSRQGTTVRNGIDANNTLSSGRTVRSRDMSASGRSSYSPYINTNTRTGVVRSSEQWNATRNSNAGRYSSETRSYGGGSSSVINRSAPDSRNTGSSSRVYNSSSSTSRSSSSYNYDRSSSNNNSYTPSRSSSSSSSRSGSYSGGSSSSSSSSSGSSRSGSGGRR